MKTLKAFSLEWDDDSKRKCRLHMARSEWLHSTFMNSNETSTAERDKTLPPRFRSTAFRRYEAVLNQAVVNFPNEIEVNPADFGLSLSTVEQRLRDAKTSFYRHEWNSTIDRAKFLSIYTQLEVRNRDGKVYIGKPTPTVKAVEGKVISPTWSLANGPTKLDNLTPNQIDLLCRLASLRCLSCPLVITIPDTLSDALFAAFDINLDKQSDGTYILT